MQPYRPEVDGLRAIAVVPVMLFHAGLGGVPAGYLGVDVFFVISGYLITRLIVVEQAEGRFTLADFYRRRVRRILPLLTVVVLACLPFAWFLLARQDAEDFGQSLVATGLFSSNFLFWHEGRYFGPAGEFKPLLHTWSLAVEEQFYIIYPLACLLALRLGRKALVIMLAVAAAASFAIMAWLLARNDYLAAFFLLPARGWQLLLGAGCAMLPAAAIPGMPRRLRDGLALLGLAMLVGAILAPAGFLADETVRRLLATLGTAGVIAFAAGGTLAARALSLRPLVAVGLVSYGAYLWHVPLLVFARHALALHADPELERVANLSPLLAAALLVTAFALAAASWRWIEQPARIRSRVPWRRLVFALVAGWTLIGAAAAAMLLTNWQARSYLQVARGVGAAAAMDYIRVQRDADLSAFGSRTTDNGACVFAAERLDAAIRARLQRCAERLGPGTMLLGDSHAQDLHNVIANLRGRERFVVTIASGGCRIADGNCFYPEVRQALAGDLAALIREIAYHEAGSRAILDSAGRPDSQRAFVDPAAARVDADHIDRTLAALRALRTASGMSVTLIGPYMEPRINLQTDQPLATGWQPRPTVRAQFALVDSALSAQAGAGQLPYVSMLGEPLAEGDSILLDGRLLYHDLDHLTAFGEARMARQLEATSHPLARQFGIADRP